MHLSLVGVNHQTAPVAVREKVAVNADKLGNALSLLQSYVPQGIILSTCNRTEIYTIHSNGDMGEASLSFLKAQVDMPHADLSKYVDISADRAAVEHLFRVTCGLESMIVGEFEVLGQVGQALEAAEKAGTVDQPLRYVFQSAIRTGRRVRQETGISKNALSASSVAVDLATNAIGELRNAKILVLGAGEAGRLVVKVARERGASQIVVASRTRERASALAATLGGRPIDLSELTDELATTNIVVACAGAPHWLLGAQQVQETMKARPGTPLVIIDIAVPRNVESAVKQIGNVFLYNIDDLTEIAESNRKQREGETEKAEAIIAAEVDKCLSWWQELQVQPVVSALMSKAEEIRATQLKKTMKRLRPLSNEEQESLEAMTKSIVTKILKDPVKSLKANGNNGDYAAVISKIFRLDEEKR
ncbi:MAG: glutamyl-tRNA reductase [Chloroflexi bacterium]|nr:glutamyl-tRNA reductase [Chloroflexota bacterium]